MAAEKDKQESIEPAVSMRLTPTNELLRYLTKAAVAYREASFKDEQKFMSLSKATLLTDTIRQFAVLHAPKKYDRLVHSLRAYNGSGKRCALADRELLGTAAQDVHQDRAVTPAPIRHGHGGLAVEARVQELASQMTELTLMMRRSGASLRPLEVREKRGLGLRMAIGGRFLRPRKAKGSRATGPAARGTPDCLYCRRFRWDEDYCWKKQKDSIVYGYCARKGHGENDC